MRKYELKKGTEMSEYLEVVNWDETNLVDLPKQEASKYEYKSSKISEQDEKTYRDALRDKIQKAASAFWNSGGGYFIVGYDEKTETIDGGIPGKMGNQNLLDWVDTVIHQVEPVGRYEATAIKRSSTSSFIAENKVVLVIGFDRSNNPPHMSTDNKYYIRAGRHTTAANHFLVEALRSKRYAREPYLRGTLRLHPQKSGIIELVISSITTVPALDVTIDFEPRPKFFNPLELPLQVSFIDNINIFRLDFAIFRGNDANENWVGYEEVRLKLNYSSFDGKSFESNDIINLYKNISHHELNISSSDDIKRSIRDMYKDIHWFKQMFQLHLLPHLSSFLENNSDKTNED